MAIKVMYVNSIGEYYNNVAKIEQCIFERKNLIKGDRDKVSTLWFRGEAQTKFTLIPSLFRDNQGIGTFEKDGQYSNMHYAEDVRMQHYSAKNYHYLQKEPSSSIEWLEVMQHHGVNTRVLDWSESSTHSLLFALEPFFNGKPIDNNSNLTPCVWILDSQGLNKDLMLALGKEVELQQHLLNNLNLSEKDITEILSRISIITKPEKLERYMQQERTYHIDYLVNLSFICDEMTRNSMWLGNMIKNGEALNPIFYLLMRIYADGYILDNYTLPPLAVVHPYHSERIRAQRGVFTVFPFYREKNSKQREALKNIGINPDSMSFNAIAQRHLYKMILCKPQKIAHEILANGMNGSWLYPEMPIAAGEIEKHQIC